MMTHSRIMKYIKEELRLSQEQKQSLVLLAGKNSDKYSSLMNWIWALNSFKTEGFVERCLFEKRDFVQTLTESRNNPRSYNILLEVSEILFGSFAAFLELVLARSRKESHPQARAFMVEFLLRLCEAPLVGSLPEDYIPGLHHKDELIRCKTALFLYKHYGRTALRPMISEVFKINYPLSLLFCKTICHFVQLHPEISWAEEVEKLKGSDGATAQTWSTSDARNLLFREMQGSLSRDRFLILNPPSEESHRQAPSEFPKLSTIAASKKDSIGVRLERFEKITSSMMGG
jgi:hypothetical protein